MTVPPSTLPLGATPRDSVEEDIASILRAAIAHPQHFSQHLEQLTHLYQRLQNLAEFRQRLVKFVSDTLDQGGGKDFYQQLLETAVSVIPGAQAGNLLLRGDDGNYHYAATVNYDLPETFSRTLIPAKDLALIYADKQPVVIQDVGDFPLPHVDYFKEQQRPLSQATLTVPVLLGGKNVAFLSVDNSHDAHAFDNEAIAMAEAFALQMAVIMKRLHLEQALRKRNQDIEESNQRLERASRYKSDFLASMSHELRTPLTSIIGFGELLREGALGELNEVQEESLDDILEAGQHLLALINDVLDLAKVEAGRMELSIEAVDLNQVVEESLRVMRERLDQGGLELNLRLPPEGAWLRGDRRKIKQVLLNLLSNAIKFTPAGGRITVRVQAMQQKRAWQVLVRDTGVGISEQDKSRLFQDFSQLTPSSKSKGTGLGLAISRRFVEMHGGYIEVTSQPNQGSTFSFVLPQIAGTNRAGGGLKPRPSQVKRLPSAEGYILIADADRSLREEIRNQLQGVVEPSLVVLESGKQVLDWLESHTPSLFITGLSLGDMSGLDVLNHNHEDLPTLLLIPADEPLTDLEDIEEVENSSISADMLSLYSSLHVVARALLLEPERFSHKVNRILLSMRELG